MKIAILSDIHDHLVNLNAALTRCRELKAEAIVCCGDLCSPFVAKALGDGTDVPVHIVFGNNDGDRFRIANVGRGLENLEFHGEYAELEFDGVGFSVNHFDTIGRGLAKGDAFDVVCFGHNHRQEIAVQGKTLIINPGEIYGGLTGRSTFVIYDTTERAATVIEVP